ncbi:Ig-like domain-containing protein [Caballeronia sordidicola]|uniref:Ig-like domain-containing protein n=1 Tax=Caballeronia sordidicola TaxID=196367 RepID=UPI000ACAD93C|nr:Ig-like domain-containing protein [Caballeronia sordidicola]
MATTSQDLNKAVITSVGLAVGGGTANSVRPVIAGTATAGMTIDVFDGVRMIGTAIANANGVWSFTPPADLKAGSHSFTAIAVDSNGDFGTSSTPMSVTVPSGTPVAPAKPIVNGMTDDAGHALTNPTNDAHPTMSGTGTPGDTITMYDGNTPIGSTIIDNTGHWVIKPTKDLNSGTHDFYVIETNPAKVPSVPSDHYPVVIDTSIPAAPVITSATDAVGPVQGLIPSGGTTDDDKPTFAGTGVKGDIVKLYDKGTLIGSVLVDSNGKWSIKPTNALSNGAHDVFATDTNTLGTTSGESTHFKFILDTTTPATPAAPILTDDNGATIPAGSTTADAHPHINGTGTAGDIIKVYDNGNVIGSTTVGGDGKWTFTPSTDLSNGTHSITVVDVNLAGTPSAASNAISVVIGVSVPDTPLTPALFDDGMNAILAGGTTYDVHPKMSGVNVPGYIVTVYDGNTVLGSTTVNANYGWSFASPNLSTGSHSISVTVTNAAGTSSAHSPSKGFSIDPLLAYPVITSIVDSVGPVQGNIAQNGTTDDPRPVMHGTGVVGDVVTVADNGKTMGSAVVDATGQWTLQPGTNLSNGFHSFVAIGKLVSDWLGGWNITVNTTTPATPATPILTDDNGALIPAGSTTADNHPHISGTGTAGDIIKVYDNYILIGSTTIGSNGQWTFTPPNLSDGIHAFIVQEVTSAGAISTPSGSISVAIDSSTPTPAKPATPTLTDDNGAIIPAGSTTADAHPHINGTGKAGDIIKVYDGSTVIGSTTIGGDGKWSFTPSPELSAGAHDIHVIETNPAGAPSPASDPVHVVIDTSTPATPAVPTLTDDNGALIPAGSTTADNHPHINGTGKAGDIITVYDGSTVLGSTTIGSNGQWTFASGNMSTGSHSINVTETNAAGTSSAHSGSIGFTYSNVSGAPTITGILDTVGAAMVAIPSGGTTNGSHPTVSGTGTAGNMVYIYENSNGCGSAVVDGTGHWSVTIPGAMGDGVHAMTATQFGSGQSASGSSNTWTITINTSVPATPVTPTLTDDNGASIPAGSTTANNHPHINGTGKAGDIITVYDGNTVLGSTTIGSNGQWSFASGNMSTGSHSINVTETNAAGTPSAHSGSIGFTYSNVAGAPTITGIMDTVGSAMVAIPDGGMTNGSHPTVSGTGTAGNTVYIYQNGTGCGNTIVDGTGHWSLTISGALGDGARAITATQFASGQNPSASSNTWIITINTSPPPAPAVPSLSDNYGSWITAGSTTTDGHPHISGTGAGAGDVIRVYDYGTLIGSAQVGGDGRWVFTPSTDLSKGSHSITVVDVNAAGTASPASGAIGFVISDVPYVPPVPTAPTITSITDSGKMVDSSSWTSPYTWVLVAGTGTPGAFISIYLHTKNGSKASATNYLYVVDNTGHWQSGARDFYLILGTTDFFVTQTISNVESAPSSVWGVAVGNYQQTRDLTVHTDDQSQVALVGDSDQSAQQTNHHTAVGEHDGFVGKLANGNETVDLNADPASYFKESTAHIQGAGGTAIDTLHLTGDHQVLDLTSLTGKTAAAKISGIEVVDLGGQHNTLKLSLIDVLNLGETDLFQKDGKQQMMVQGKEGDTVDLSNTHIAGLADGEWAAHGTAVVGGVTYNVYEHSGAHTELLVQQGVQIVVH